MFTVWGTINKHSEEFSDRWFNRLKDWMAGMGEIGEIVD
jgi:hypothetical protein